MPRPVVDAMQAHVALGGDDRRLRGRRRRKTRSTTSTPPRPSCLGQKPGTSRSRRARQTRTRAPCRRCRSRRGDVVLTTRDDYISNQIAFLSLRKRFGIEVVHAPNRAGGGVDVDDFAALARSRRPRLVAVTHVPTNSGLVQPVAEIGRSAVSSTSSTSSTPASRSASIHSTSRSSAATSSRRPAASSCAARAAAECSSSRTARSKPASSRSSSTCAVRTGTRRRSTARGDRGAVRRLGILVRAVLGAAAAIRYALAVGLERIASAHRRWPRICATASTRSTAPRPRSRPGAVRDRDLHHRRSTESAALRAGHARDQLERRPARVRDVRRRRQRRRRLLRLSPHYYNTAEEVGTVVETISALA